MILVPTVERPSRSKLTQFQTLKDYIIINLIKISAMVNTKSPAVREIIVNIKGNEFICPNCGHQGIPKGKSEQSPIVLIMLWILFFFLGMILIFNPLLWLIALISLIVYTISFFTSIHKTCPKCKNNQVIPLETPRGTQLFNQFYGKEYAAKAGIYTAANIKIVKKDKKPSIKKIC